MTRYKYHLTPNAFEELPGMEEPDATKILGDSPSGADYEVLDDLMDDYRAHLFTLHDGKHKPMIPGSPECREYFEDGQVVEEGQDVSVCHLHADCYSAPGTKLIADFVDGKLRGGYDYEEQRAMQYLSPGVVYELARADVDSWSTDFYLVQFPGVAFNSVQFLYADPIIKPV